MHMYIKVERVGLIKVNNKREKRSGKMDKKEIKKRGDDKIKRESVKRIYV